MLCIISVIALCYWVFTFIVMNVFGLKVFRENLTETFYLSILGILALLFGALITNIMFNLTRIAEKHNSDTADIKQTSSKILLACFLIVFPLLALLLFLGDYVTTHKKERILVQSAESIVAGNKTVIDELAHYEFTKEWINNTVAHLNLLSKLDRNYADVSIVVSDVINDAPVFLIFERYYYLKNDDDLNKVNFVFQSDIKQRKYLEKVFQNNTLEKNFSAFDGYYEMFYPIKCQDKIIVLYFQDRQQYGKIGS